MFSPCSVEDGATDGAALKLTGVPFNDAYRYMDGLLIVLTFWIKILPVMKQNEIMKYVLHSHCSMDFSDF